MASMALTVDMIESAIKAENITAKRGPKRLAANSEPTAVTPLIDSSAVG
jgi:hypothetical protein